MDEEDPVSLLSKSVPFVNLITDEKIRLDTASIFIQLLKESHWKTLEEQAITSSIPVSGIEHVNSVVQMCIRIGETLQKMHHIPINNDFLIAGAILHDASKLSEYEPTDSGEQKTKLGELGQHTIRCVSLILSKKMPEEILHIVISHTPQSRTIPKTIEAIILYFADGLDYNVLRVTNGMSPDITK